ncbi:ABC transporter permease [Aeoliella sp.]|uniref:ABC transporter permease n=1 Tax=Aeoliella sp. TaxID=2795800 RepID=UPI003CCC3F36
MKSTVPPIPLENLALALLPVLVVIIIVHRWGLGVWTPLYATARMLVQLVAVGYVLKYLFLTDSPWVVLATLTIMLVVASWISLRPVKHKSAKQYLWALLAIACGGGGVVFLMTQGVLELDKWYDPQRVIPLAGMSLTAAMNCVSLAAERFEAELGRDADHHEARRQAMHASLITVTNSLLAVGLVSLPGLMTGQILAGISPLIASRYQIMIMCMVFSAGGIAAAVYLWLVGDKSVES